ncbi:MAG: SLC13 family permease [Pseudomonadales bacterium]
MINKNSLLILLGPVIALITYALCRQSGLEYPAAATAGVTLLCLVWWVFEPIPIPVTSLMPLALFPLLGILTGIDVAQAYGSPLILLLLGGFLLSRAMESTGAHRRVALFMVALFGSMSARRLIMGFMVASAVLSMWISNTATTLMLLPVALAILERAEDKRLAVPLLLGVAYAASIGGMGTPIGTPPNLVFMQVYREHTGVDVGFVQWMSWAVPVVVVMVPVAAFWLTRNLKGVAGVDIPAQGSWTTAQRRVMVVFALTALAWITRKAPFGGWSGIFDMPYANDASVAFIAVAALFIVSDGKGGKLLDWAHAERIPWGVLLLFSGGITLAKAFQQSGLSSELAGLLSAVSILPVILMIALLALGVSFLTETTSNTASTTLLMPVLAATAIAADIDPALLMVPAAMSASCAFMLPVATAPNSVVYGSGVIPAGIMAREGFVLNLFGAVIITLVCYWRLA